MDIMSLLRLVLVLALLGLGVWVIITYIPMPAPIKQIIIAVVAILVVFWAITFLLGGGGLHIGHT